MSASVPGLRRASKTTCLMLILTVTVLAISGVACDDSAADRKVRQDLRQAQAAAAPGGEAALTAAIIHFQSAASNADASKGMQAAAKAALAQAQMDKANELVRQLDALEAKLTRIGWEITQLGLQVHTSGSAIVGYKQFDPKAAREEIAKKVAEAQGGPGKAEWFKHGDAVIPTLSAAKQEIAKLEGEISQLQEQVKNITDQRTKLLDEAEQAYSQSEQLKGEQAVEVYKKSSDLRRQAGEKAIELDKLNAQIARLQRELTVWQGQQVILAEVITQLQDQAASLNASWKNIDDQIKSHQELARQILGTAPAEVPASTSGLPMAAKAMELGRLVKEVETLRTTAEAALTDASKLYADAYTSANDMVKDLKDLIGNPSNAGRPEMKAWEQLQETLDPLQYRYQQAAVQRALGAFYAARAHSAANRIAMRDTVKKAFELAGLRVPEQITGGDLDKERTTNQGLADEAYKQSKELLTDVIEGQTKSKDLQPMARLSRALTLYGWAQTERMVKKEKEAADHIKEAIVDRDLAAEHNMPVPGMPVELGAPPVKAAPPPDATEAAATGDDAPIKEMLAKLGEALSKGETEAARAFFQADAGQEQVVEQILTIASETRKLRDTAKEKFGEEAVAAMAPPAAGGTDTAAAPPAGMPAIDPAMLQQMTKIEVKGDDGIINAPTGPIKLFTKVDGQWKVHVGAPTGPMEQAIYAVVEKASTSLTTMNADLQSGKIASVDDLKKAMQTMQQEIMAQVMATMMGAATGAGTGGGGGETPPQQPAPAPQ